MMLMDINITLIISLLAFSTILIGIGIWSRFKQTHNEFLIGARKTGILQTATSMLAVYGGVFFISQPALAFNAGFSALWVFIGLSLGTFLLGLSASKIKPLADKHKFLTISDYLFIKFDKKTGILSAIINFISFFSLLVGQFIAGATIFSAVFKLSYTTAIIVMGVITLIYLLLGGFKAVLRTDALQAFIMVFLLLALTIVTSQNSSITTEVFHGFGFFSAVSYLFTGIFVYFGAGDIWQRIYSSRSSLTAKHASYLAAILSLLFGLLLTVTGVLAKINFPDIKPENALYYGLFNLLPSPLLNLALLVILAGILSTIDTELFLLSTIIAKDGFYRSKSSSMPFTTIIKISLPLLTLVSALIAIWFSDILFVLFAMLSLLQCIAPSVIASFFTRLSNTSAFMSMLAGFFTLIALILLGKFSPDTSSLTLPISVVVLIFTEILVGGKHVQTT